MKKLSFQARITEVDDVSNRILVLYKKEASMKKDTFLKEVFDELESISLQITEAIKRDVVLSNLEEVNKKRDNSVRILHKVLVGYLSMPIPEIKEKAEKVNSVFSKYGVKITRESYASKSSLIEALLSDLSVSELQETINELIGVKECIEQIRNEQISFTNYRLDYEKASAQQKKLQPASALRKSLLDIINGKLVTYLTAMKLSNTSEYGNFASMVSQTIDDTNTSIKKRTSTKTEKITK